ncbi:CHASE2 domain-containing protein [Coleofasciculus sp. FACHB-T130]|uniref:CHASE2 domain-containing protein n=1 Tax=Cyanophyceae TaxID=3028117 RepID=UPI0016837723|nr:CHASE2 domain-containing protein [Coleofasciculus sp. FACHB-T130]MBD1879739.1 CHASE2 domain-containing protein [Coleofasciculus sp. FACHB-T130]
MLGTQLGGRYKVVKVLGAGGFSQTYIAEDTQRPRNPKCVVKHLKPARQDPAFLQVARRMFKTEAKTLEKLGHHQQIPHLLAYFEQDQQFYLVQEFIEGSPLSDELHQGTRLSESEIIQFLQDVLGILEFVHAYQVIHRDIKPSNLIRRRQDGKLVLIDFGAVKEIRTQLTSGTDQTSITVGIGTQGYVPSEQLAGKPKYSSDIYALGITAIQLLTGLRPNQLPEDPETSEIIWRDKVKVSDRLAAILDKMVRYHFRDRYQSATEVSQAIASLTEVSLSENTPVAEKFDPENIADKSGEKISDRAGVLEKKASPIRLAIASILATGLLLGVRQLGGLQSLELATFDQMVRLRFATRVLGDLDRSSPMEGPDPRLLVVEITEADIKAQNRYPLSDRTLHQLLAQLERHQPRVIGLDIYRDIPMEPGHAELSRQLQKSDRIITVCKISDIDNPGVAPPKIVPEDRLSFDDLVIDPDNAVRRSLLFATSDVGACKTPYSLGARLALRYLEQLGIEAQPHPKNYLQLNSIVFKPLEANFGGYQQADSGGYQILLDYRSAHNIAQQVTLTEVLKGQINPDWVKDRIVLIGVTSPTVDNVFYTPYGGSRKMFGVRVQAQTVSQILSVVLDKRPLFWSWSEWVEVLWIVGWAAVGGILAWRIRHPLRLIVVGTATLGILFVTGFYFFMQAGWVPVAAPALGLLGSGGSTIVCRLAPKRRKQEQPKTPQETLSAPIDNCPPEESIPADTLFTQEVNFHSGSTQTTMGGNLEPNQCHSFSLSATEGQLLTVAAVEGNVNITVIDPEGQTVGTITDGAQWQALLPSAGNYKIEVYAPDASVYTVSFDVGNDATESSNPTILTNSQLNSNNSLTETRIDG